MNNKIIKIGISSFYVVMISGLLFLGVKADEMQVEKVSDNKLKVDLAFKTHLDANLPEQDVFIERTPGSGDVYRVTNGDHDMSAQLFKTAVSVPHNPFSDSALGPHPKGEPMGMTLGQWLQHSGKGAYSCEDGQGKLELSFSGLVPEGVYTIWHAFMAMPPPEPFTGSLDVPLGARDGSESVFLADSEGNADFVHSFSPCLQLSDVWTSSMLAVNWHSDGKTYGGHPGPFGSASHIPLFVMLPKREGL
ncbi:MAG: hypothetical protein V7731_01455 [Amphritea sp.]